MPKVPVHVSRNSDDPLEDGGDFAGRSGFFDVDGADGMTCPDCRSMNQRFLRVSDTGWVEFACLDCGCVFAAKTEVKVLKHGTR